MAMTNKQKDLVRKAIRVGKCPIAATVRVLCGRWKLLILWRVLDGISRFGALHRSMPTITRTMLTSTLRELEADGIIHRKVYAQVPPKVEYTVTPYGKTIWPILEVMYHWGKTHRELREGVDYKEIVASVDLSDLP